MDGPVDIGGGRHLYLHCAGPTTTGRPTIVLESGYHDSSDPWSLTDAQAPARGPSTFERLSQGNRVCAYDRPGTFRYTDPLALTDRSSPVPRIGSDRGSPNRGSVLLSKRVKALIRSPRTPTT